MESVKEKIIQTATTLFACHGIEAVHMEQIAEEAGVNAWLPMIMFGGKGQLVMDCLRPLAGKMRDLATRTADSAKSPLEALLVISISGLYFVSEIGATFIKDLKRYPSIIREMDAFRADLQQQCGLFFSRCIDEGYFRPDINRGTIAPVFIEQVGNVASNFQLNIIKSFFRGLCTEKGKEEMVRLSKIYANGYPLSQCSR